jgi:hypothetical protein
LERLRLAVNMASQKSNSNLQELQESITEEFELVTRENSVEPEASFLDVLSIAKEDAELSELLSRLKDMENRMNDVDEDGDFSEGEEESCEVFNGVIDGIAKKFCCYKNGTFRMEDP